MFSCLGRLGCLFLILVGGALAWLTRERWLSSVPGREARPPVVWEAMSDTGARTAADAVASLGRPGGAAYATVTAAGLAALMAGGAGYGLPAALDSVQAAVDGDLIRLRARVQLDAVRGLDALGPLGGLLDRRERIELAGAIAVLRPGLAEFRVGSVQVADLALPRAAIPKLIARLDSPSRPDGVSPDGIAISVPDHVGDIRVARGQVTLYRRAP